MLVRDHQFRIICVRPNVLSTTMINRAMTTLTFVITYVPSLFLSKEITEMGW